ncbi:PTS sugar transporter subunit IIA [Oceanobacillus jeddahense]|uniref:PTS sugar transporter subunit IIA n=1 Tax=Oceanobacillus jeddahense TaxID=1462527 RepID=UPI000595D831|nr:PTS sugar transporter subunit IIA [Oceanobacillus jeddahense]
MVEIESILKEENILLNTELKTRNDAIELSGKILVENGYVTEKYIEYMKAREELVTTYIGNNVAIPHGVEDSADEILKPGISLIQVPEGVPFGEEIAYVIIGIAGKDGEHLEMLSQIAILCSDEANVEKIRHAKTKLEILEMLGGIA